MHTNYFSDSQIRDKSLSTAFNPAWLDSMLIWLIALCSLKFYTFLISVTISKATVLGGLMIVVFFLGIHLVYGKGSGFKKHFKAELWMIFISLFISVFAANVFHEQNIGSTLFAQYEFYFFIFYFLLHRLKPDPDKLLNMFLWLGYGYSIIYFIQYIAYPMEIVSSKAIEDRGTIRILMPGAEFLITAWFILLSRFFTTRSIKHIIGLLPFVIILILLATRQVIAATVLLTILAIIFSKTLKSKFAVIGLIVVAIIPFYFLFQGIFDQMMDVSRVQRTNMGENIRMLAARYFLFDLNPNPVWIITGNGMPGPSSTYGKFLFRISEELGYHQSDVGLIGSFSRFGILFALAELIFLFRLVFFKVNEKYTFIRYNALMMLLTLFTGAGLRSSTIVLLCFMFYIIDSEKSAAFVKQGYEIN
jgi:hypothetical protein